MKTNRPAARRCYLAPMLSAVLFCLLFLLASLFQFYLVLQPSGIVFLLLIPAAVFSVIACFSGKIGGPNIAVFTHSLLFSFLVLSVLLAGGILFSAIEQETRDPGMYGRVLRFYNYPQAPMIRYFPREIPDNAAEVEFYHSTSMIDNSYITALKFKMSEDEIRTYSSMYLNLAQWKGTLGDDRAIDYGLALGSLNVLSYRNQLPSDITIFVLYWKNNGRAMNNGRRCIVTISPSEHEIMYLAEEWHH